MTGLQTWSTDLVPRTARFPAWAEKVQALHLDWDLAAPGSEDYDARIRYRGAGPVRVADVTCGPFAGRHPEASTAGIVGIQLQVAGRLTCTYGGATFTIEPGDLFVWDSFRGGAFEADGPHRQISLLVPAERVPRTVLPLLDEARTLAALPGAGVLHIAAGQLQTIAGELEHLSDYALSRTIGSLLDVLDTAFTPAMTATSEQRGALVAEVQRYVAERLDDQRLSVSSIAAAHRVSVRTLHLAFSESGTTVARWVRQQRLERCRTELATGTTTVTAVAHRWGFSDASHFSRSFKQTFGVPPASVIPR